MTRAQASLAILTASAILSAGVLAQALAAPASGTADLIVAVSALFLVASAILLVRVLRYLTRARAGATPPARRPPEP